MAATCGARRSAVLADGRCWRQRLKANVPVHVRDDTSPEAHVTASTASHAVVMPAALSAPQSCSSSAEPLPPPLRTDVTGPVAQGSASASDMLEGMGSANLDDVGLGLSEYELEPMNLGPGGLRAALERGDEKAMKRIAKRIGKDWWVALDWGEPPSGGWARVTKEGECAWPLMEPGRIKNADGSFTEGVSPSGAPRGDRFILANDPRLGEGDEAFGAVRYLTRQLHELGNALDARLVEEPRLQMKIIGHTDALFACFPGEGAKYNWCAAVSCAWLASHVRQSRTHHRPAHTWLTSLSAVCCYALLTMRNVSRTSPATTTAVLAMRAS